MKGTKFGKWGIETKEKEMIISFKYDEIDDFVNGKAKARKGRKCWKYGYIDEQGNTIIPFEYDTIDDFVNGKVRAKRNGYWSTLDEQGNDIDVDISSLKINSMQKGKITNIVDYGLFIMLECGVTGLLHISELKKHNKICANFNMGDDIDVKILNIDKKRNRITLTLF